MCIPIPTCTSCIGHAHNIIIHEHNNNFILRTFCSLFCTHTHTHTHTQSLSLSIQLLFGGEIVSCYNHMVVLILTLLCEGTWHQNASGAVRMWTWNRDTLSSYMYDSTIHTWRKFLWKIELHYSKIFFWPSAYKVLVFYPLIPFLHLYEKHIEPQKLYKNLVMHHKV